MSRLPALSPVCALLIRQAVSWEREFLADADATLLRRDPEALAFALVKVGAARGDRLRVAEGVVHLCVAQANGLALGGMRFTY